MHPIGADNDKEQKSCGITKCGKEALTTRWLMLKSRESVKKTSVDLLPGPWLVFEVSYQIIKTLDVTYCLALCSVERVPARFYTKGTTQFPRLHRISSIPPSDSSLLITSSFFAALFQSFICEANYN